MDFGKYVRTVPDFPKKGILFYDLMPLFGSSEGFPRLIEAIAEGGRTEKLAHVVGIEARGFIVGSALANRLGIGFVPIRKKGKLPGAVRELSYALEYGQDTIAIQEGAIGKGARVLLVDDLLATGGTAKAALDLLDQVGADVVETVFVAELIGLGGRERLAGRKMRSLLTYHVSE